MSEFHVGLITEGPTDAIILERIVGLLCPENRHAVVTTISPTETELMNGIPKPEGFGWGGVYKVCRNLEWKLALQRKAGICYDLIVIHVDGDVGNKTYQSANIVPFPEAGILPSFDQDKTVIENCEMLKQVVATWIAFSNSKVVYCIPYINMDIWAAFSLYPKDRNYLFESWTEEQLNSFLLMKGKQEGRLIRNKAGRIRKIPNSYRNAAQKLTIDVWHELTVSMEQAMRFESDLKA